MVTVTVSLVVRLVMEGIGGGGDWWCLGLVEVGGMVVVKMWWEYLKLVFYYMNSKYYNK